MHSLLDMYEDTPKVVSGSEFRTDESLTQVIESRPHLKHTQSALTMWLTGWSTGPCPEGSQVPLTDLSSGLDPWSGQVQEAIHRRVSRTYFSLCDSPSPLLSLKINGKPWGED